MSKTRPATTTDAGDKGCQNFTSSAELSCMEYDCDLKTYCQQNKTKDLCHNLGFSIGIFPMRTSGKSITKKNQLYVSLLLNALQRKGGLYMVNDCFFAFFFFAQKVLVSDILTDQIDAQGQTGCSLRLEATSDQILLPGDLENSDIKRVSLQEALKEQLKS